MIYDSLLEHTRALGLCTLSCMCCNKLYVASYAELVGAIQKRYVRTCPTCLPSKQQASINKEPRQRFAPTQNQQRKSHHELSPGAWMPYTRCSVDVEDPAWDWRIQDDELLPWERPGFRVQLERDAFAS